VKRKPSVEEILTATTGQLLETSEIVLEIAKLLETLAARIEALEKEKP
jgi:hypothetical protein